MAQCMARSLGFKKSTSTSNTDILWAHLIGKNLNSRSTNESIDLRTVLDCLTDGRYFKRMIIIHIRNPLIIIADRQNSIFNSRRKDLDYPYRDIWTYSNTVNFKTI
jgi:hypothetical protein